MNNPEYFCIFAMVYTQIQAEKTTLITPLFILHKVTLKLKNKEGIIVKNEKRTSWG